MIELFKTYKYLMFCSLYTGCVAYYIDVVDKGVTFFGPSGTLPDSNARLCCALELLIANSSHHLAP